MATAEQISSDLQAARAEWRMSEQELAARAQLDIDVAHAALQGDADASDLAALAAALGGTLDDLMAGRNFWAAPATAFKSAPTAAEESLVRAALLRVSSAARDRALLAGMLGLAQVGSDRGPLGPTAVRSDVTDQAEELAVSVRQQLGLGTEPITSIREAMARLGVPTFLTDLGTAAVDGMTWRDEAAQAAAAANTRARGGKLTALRMTFAHELCHVLFDGTKLERFGVVENRSDLADAREQRANAFAAHLLAPRVEVVRFLRERGISEQEKPKASDLRALSEHFVMGVGALAGHLVSIRLWDKTDMAVHHKLFSRSAEGADNGEARPTDAESQVAIERRGDVLDLATRALERGLIGVGRWREILGLGAADEWRNLLEERRVGLDVEQRSPL